MTRNQRRPTFLTAFGVLAFTANALLGCAPTPEPSPTPSVTAFASEGEAFAAAEEAYARYMTAFNQIDFADPSTFEPLLELSSGSYQAGEKKFFSEMHAEGNSRSGDIQTEWFEGTSVSISGEILARVCSNVSDSELTDPDGKSLVAPTRPVRYTLDLTFAIEGGILKIVSGTSSMDDKCPPQ